MSPIDQRSKLLFNNVHLLRVAAAIAASTDEVDAVTLQGRLSLAQSSIHRTLHVFEGVELLKRLERTSRTEPVRYQRANHPFWDAATRLVDGLERER